jgi:cytochrome c2
MHLTVKIRNWMAVNNIDFRTYTTQEMYSFFVKNTSNYNTTYKSFQRTLHYLEFGNKNKLEYKIEKKEKGKKVMRKCTKCHKTFETEIDEFGIPYATRCNNCKTSEKEYSKYYNYLKGVRA